MVDTTVQKNATMNLSVLICDEQKCSAHNIDNTNTKSTSIIIKHTKEYNISDT